MKLTDPKILIPALIALIAIGAFAVTAMHSHDNGAGEHGHSHEH